MRAGKGAKRNDNDRKQPRGGLKVPAEVSLCAFSLFLLSQFLPLKNGIVLAMGWHIGLIGSRQPSSVSCLLWKRFAF